MPRKRNIRTVKSRLQKKQKKVATAEVNTPEEVINDCITIDKSYLECSVCLSVYETPITIPCGHTFCHKCILASVIYTIDKGECPECRYSIDYAGILNFKKNIVIAKLSEKFNPLPKPTTCKKVIKPPTIVTTSIPLTMNAADMHSIKHNNNNHTMNIEVKVWQNSSNATMPSTSGVTITNNNNSIITEDDNDYSDSSSEYESWTPNNFVYSPPKQPRSLITPSEITGRIPIAKGDMMCGECCVNLFECNYDVNKLVCGELRCVGYDPEEAIRRRNH